MKSSTGPLSANAKRGAESPVAVLPELAAVESQSPALTVDPAADPASPSDGFTPELIVDLFAKSGAMFFRWEPTRGLTFLSGQPPLALGYTREEVLRDPMLVERIVRPDFRENISRFITHLHEAAHRVSHIEIPFVSKGDATVWYEARVLPRIGPSGRVEGFLGVAFEVDERGSK